DLKQRHPAFKDNPVLLKPADRVRLTRVTDEDLQEIRRRVFDGTFRYDISPEKSFSVKEYMDFRNRTKEETEAFMRKSREAANKTPPL
ncbi:urea amidolyase, partial [Candidatus Bathyarchaeota archaeon]|nr:urea amidolyase [Candidatus Bathyarchaeota archaeon]